MVDYDELEPTIDRSSTVDIRQTSLDQTLNIAPESLRQPQSNPQSKLDVQCADVSMGCDEATRQLLRQRLLVAAMTGAVLLVSIKMIGFFLGQLSFFDVVTRMTALSVLLGASFFLRQRVNMSLQSLRRLEILIFAIPLVETAWILVMEGNELIANGRPESVATLFANVSMAVALFIAIYGMYIPSTWKRTLILMGSASLVPTIVCLIYVSLRPELSLLDQPGFITPLLTVMMALIATQAAHVVNKIRREVESFKQYGQYELVEEIGRGGMGVVYKARHRMLKRPAAIKLIHNESAQDKRAILNFESEVQLSATLSHWNTVQIYDYGRTDDGDFFYVMEYLTGETLKDRILNRSKDPMGAAQVVSIMSQVCDGLAEAHKRDMVHRDLKPANIFLSNSGGCRDVVKILDFGLAIRSSDVMGAKSISGSPAYMAPEQIEQRPVDPRSDIYALGCVMFECLTGEKLFSGTSMREVFDNHLAGNHNLSRLTETEPELAAIVEKCVGQKPSDRFAEINDLRNALSQIEPTLVSS